MTDKASAAGWVVEVKRSPKDAREAVQTAYFDVAVNNAAEAVAAATRKSGFVGGSGRTVRPLSSQEIESMGLKIGQVKPA
jgi:hypothetical protein